MPATAVAPSPIDETSWLLTQWSRWARIAREAHLDRRTVRYRLDAAVAWVAGRLDREEY